MLIARFLNLFRKDWCKETRNQSELAMARVNSDESQKEARTSEPCNTLGRAVVRSEKLIELGNSWFSPK